MRIINFITLHTLKKILVGSNFQYLSGYDQENSRFIIELTLKKSWNILSKVVLQSTHYNWLIISLIK